MASTITLEPPETTSTSNNINNNNSAKTTVVNNELLLQIKALQNLKKSIRRKTFEMKKSDITTIIDVGDLEANTLKNDCEEPNKERLIFKRDTKKQYFTNFMAELLGTALLMFLGCMGCAPQADNPPAVHHMSSLSFGLVILLIIQTFGHISGAHLNPAVTISTVIFRMLSPAMGIVYIAAQFIGAIFGFALLRVLMPQTWVVPGFCATKPHEQSTPMQAVAIETIITCVLILVCCGVWDKRNETKQDSTPARFGFIVAAISMVAGPITGASMNTARSFAPAIMDSDFTNQWIYWIGPNVGAVLGSGIYSLIFSYEKLQEDDEDATELEEINQIITTKA